MYLFVGSNSIWIIGSSLVANAATHVVKRPTGKNLGFEKMGIQVIWVGMPGMRWNSMVSLVHAMVNAFGIPRALLLHVGANDIGAWSTRDLIYHMTFALFIIQRMVPGCALIYSSMLPRTSWRYSFNCGAMERSRKRVNRGLRTYLLNNGGYVLKHTDLDDGHKALFASDGIHLSFLGNDIFINAIQGAIEHFLMYPNARIFPTV